MERVDNYDWYEIPENLGNSVIDKNLKKAYFDKQLAEGRIRYWERIKREREAERNKKFGGGAAYCGIAATRCHPPSGEGVIHPPLPGSLLGEEEV